MVEIKIIKIRCILFLSLLSFFNAFTGEYVFKYFNKGDICIKLIALVYYLENDIIRLADWCIIFLTAKPAI